ncbi:hypothetical protein M0802_015596 [Mischocyttarus mexicanus]|nr:hypothetical protein M0802_015596 [Mischocyttarus mexicanus]
MNRPPKIKYNPEYIQKINIESLENASTRNMYKKRLETKIEENNINESDTVKENWKKLAKNILIASEETLGKKQGKLTRQIPVNTGIRQGNSLGPFLFNLVMNKIIESVKPMTEYKMGNRNFNILCYADDAVLIANSEDNLQMLLHKFNITSKKYNMIISAEKTKCMTTFKEPIRCKLETDGRIIEQTMAFNYFGVEREGPLTHRHTLKTVAQEIRYNNAIQS